MAQVEKAVAGIDGIVHLGGFSVEGPWETILNSNIIGCYNLFEAARKASVKRIIFATSNHAVGYLSAPPQDRHRRAGAPGFALWREQGVRRGARRDVCLQARPERDLPAHRQCRRRAARPAAAVDLAASGRSRAAHPHRARASRHPLRDFLRRARTTSAPGGTTSTAFRFGYRPKYKAEDFRDQALAAQAKLAADPVGDWYQGGTFCSAEFDADAGKLAQF